MREKTADFAALCEAWARVLLERYEIEINADAVGMILTRLGNGTRQDVDVVMRYIGSRERDDRLSHVGVLKTLSADHAERVDSIRLKARQERRALQDRRSRDNSKLRLSLMQCDTQLERGAVYAAHDKKVDEVRALMESVDDAEHLQLVDERNRYNAEVEREELRHGRVLYHWRMWRDATDRMCTLGLVLPEEEEGGAR